MAIVIPLRTEAEARQTWCPWALPRAPFSDTPPANRTAYTDSSGTIVEPAKGAECIASQCSQWVWDEEKAYTDVALNLGEESLAETVEHDPPKDKGEGWVKSGAPYLAKDPFSHNPNTRSYSRQYWARTVSGRCGRIVAPPEV